jgi:uncharacterized membrane protein YsdA (DUF1294 family)
MLAIGALLIQAAILAALVYEIRFRFYAALAVLLLSALTYQAYKIDKRAAERGQRRMPENRLHFVSLLGGWPGALVAQNRLRHKSSKLGFKICFYITILLNLTALGCFPLLQESRLWNNLQSLIHQAFRFFSYNT